MKENNLNGKIYRALKKMDDVLAKNGYFNYQERFHRIYKTLLSIERHEDCYVSKFSLEEGNKNELVGDYSNLINESFISNYLSISTDNKIEIENDDKTVTKLEMDDLLNFIEDELNLKNLISLEDTTFASSSSEEEDSEKEENKITKQPVVKTMNKESMQRKFFNIELRLRAYLKEERLFRTGFDSFLNENKMKTPLSKISPTKNVMPSIIKNFFDDKIIVEDARKRYSVREVLTGKLSGLGNAEEIMKCNSNFEKISMKHHTNVTDNSMISQFSIDSGIKTSSDSLLNLSNSTKNNTFNINKRGSIFKDRYINDFPIIEEHMNFDESMSEESDENMSENEEHI